MSIECSVKRIGGGNCEGAEDESKCALNTQLQRVKNNASRFSSIFRGDDAEKIRRQCAMCPHYEKYGKPFDEYEEIKSGNREIEIDDDNTLMNPWTSTK